MGSEINTVALLVKELNNEIQTLVNKLLDFLIEIGIKVILVEPFTGPSLKSTKNLLELKETDIQLIITIGGDGTVLRTVRQIDREIPILPINVGGKGILSEIVPKDAPFAIKKLVDGNFFLDKRLRIIASTDRETFSPALNEIFLDRISQTRLPNFMIKKEPDVLLEQRMDGLIVTTPTGTTAHAFSGGGPVIYEGLKLISLTPVCPLSRLPSLILPVEPIEISCSNDCNLVIDGQEVHLIPAEKKIIIKGYPKDAIFVRFNKKGFQQLDNLGFK